MRAFSLVLHMRRRQQFVGFFGMLNARSGLSALSLRLLPQQSLAIALGRDGLCVCIAGCHDDGYPAASCSH
ncbi:hypothetical protein BDV39DRAFT_164983 [Aspergillus sergii]|uniref:Uncharacterized protein n=1 Tax=Aspergillus sergii TaxID=1034303 RepID=A0A5N6XLN4_9EURO|nr:hypothetical protein BDV39DRAFT_164983 [Aspergillus sergii]